MLQAQAITFDTHRFVKHLTESGFTEKQAETLAEEQVALLNTNLATKPDIEMVKADIETLRLETKADIEAVKADIETRADIEALRQETKAGIETLRQETKADIARLEAGIETLRQETKGGIEALRLETRADIASLKADLLKWMFGALIAQGGLIVALVKFLN